jgi:hypothetical protein
VLDGSLISAIRLGNKMFTQKKSAPTPKKRSSVSKPSAVAMAASLVSFSISMLDF